MAPVRFSRPVLVEVTTPKGEQKHLRLEGPADAIHAMGQDGLGKLDLGPDWQLTFSLLTRAALHTTEPEMIERARAALVDLVRKTKELRAD